MIFIYLLINILKTCRYVSGINIDLEGALAALISDRRLLASDSMDSPEERHSLPFFFMPLPKDFQCVWWGVVPALQVRSALSGALGPLLPLLGALRRHRFGYGLGIFQGLRWKEREREISRRTY